MSMRTRIARLFTIKTRTEAWLIIYAIALGAVERARTYVEAYPGIGGWLLALACTGVVFLAGAKLLDSVTTGRSAEMPVRAPARSPRRHSAFSRSRPKLRPTHRGATAPALLRKD
jgi:hypothetical protein